MILIYCGNYCILLSIFEKNEVNKFIVTNKVSNKVSNKANGTKEKIISAIRNNPNVTINQLTVITGLFEPRVKKSLKQLKDAGIIAWIGANKNVYWEVLKWFTKWTFGMIHLKQ